MKFPLRANISSSGWQSRFQKRFGAGGNFPPQKGNFSPRKYTFHPIDLFGSLFYKSEIVQKQEHESTKEAKITKVRQGQSPGLPPVVCFRVFRQNIKTDFVFSW